MTRHSNIRTKEQIGIDVNRCKKNEDILMRKTDCAPSTLENSQETPDESDQPNLQVQGYRLLQYHIMCPFDDYKIISKL